MSLTVITKRPVKPNGHSSNKCLAQILGCKRQKGLLVIRPCTFQRRLLLIYKEPPQPSFNSYFHFIPVFSLHIYTHICIHYSHGCTVSFDCVNNRHVMKVRWNAHFDSLPNVWEQKDKNKYPVPRVNLFTDIQLSHNFIETLHRIKTQDRDAIVNVYHTSCMFIFVFVQAALPGRGTGCVNNAWLAEFPEGAAGLFSERWLAVAHRTHSCLCSRAP